jgi:LPXTG-site transpeptidase (sortase) family protein
MKKSLALKLYLTGGALIIAALVIGAQTINWPLQVQASQVTVNLAPATTPASQPGQPQQKIGGTPVRIVVPNRTIDLPVIQGSYDPDTGNWTLSNNKAQFALNSSVANNKLGNTFIYGHDIPQVFKRLEGLVAGDIAQIYTDNGYVFTYKYRSSIDVDPSNTNIFSYSGPSILTLQTCSGVWSQNRHLMTFDFVEVRKA